MSRTTILLSSWRSATTEALTQVLIAIGVVGRSIELRFNDQPNHEAQREELDSEVEAFDKQLLMSLPFFFHHETMLLFLQALFSLLDLDISLFSRSFDEEIVEEVARCRLPPGDDEHEYVHAHVGTAVRALPSEAT